MTSRALRFLIAFSLVFTISTPSFAATPSTFVPQRILEDRDIVPFDNALRPLFDRITGLGTLTQVSFTDESGLQIPAAELIWQTAQKSDVNPLFLLALLQKEQSLVEDADPTPAQWDWAYGYGVCDACDKNDPSLQTYKGFTNQIRFAASTLRDRYWRDLVLTGKTSSGFGPGITTTIDGSTIIPANKATAVLYTYTPHTAGNLTLYRIYQRWFGGSSLPSGTVIQDNQTYWYVHGNEKTKFDSLDLLRRVFPSQPILIPKQTPEQLLADYDESSHPFFPNYSLLEATDKTRYLLSNGVLQPFTSNETFRSIGFNPDELIPIEDKDRDFYPIGAPITSDSSYPEGILLKHPINGGLIFVQNSTIHPIFAKELVTKQLNSLPIQTTSLQELSTFKVGTPVLFADGTLVKTPTSPDVFVISGGKRRPIQNEQTFLKAGWNWSDIVIVNERTVLLHPLGNPYILN